MSTYDMLRAHYATRSDEELKSLAGTPDLPPDARRALDDELAQRKADPETRRQAAIAALMAGLEQEKQERLAKARRVFTIGIAAGLILVAILTVYFVQQAIPPSGKHRGIVYLLVLAVVVGAGILVVRHFRRANAEQHQSEES